MLQAFMQIMINSSGRSPEQTCEVWYEKAFGIDDSLRTKTEEKGGITFLTAPGYLKSIRFRDNIAQMRADISYPSLFWGTGLSP